jgi:hypothetical protein
MKLILCRTWLNFSMQSNRPSTPAVSSAWSRQVTNGIQSALSKIFSVPVYKEQATIVMSSCPGMHVLIRDEHWHTITKAEMYAQRGTDDDFFAEYLATPEEALAPEELDRRLPFSWLEGCLDTQASWEGSSTNLDVSHPASPSLSPTSPLLGVVVHDATRSGALFPWMTRQAVEEVGTAQVSDMAKRLPACQENGTSGPSGYARCADDGTGISLFDFQRAKSRLS